MSATPSDITAGDNGSATARIADAARSRRAGVTAIDYDELRPPRPMLARDADSIYWMSRYVERAEHVARILLINLNLLTDVGDLGARLHRRQWLSILNIMHLTEAPAQLDPLHQRIPHYMTFDESNPNSLVSCLIRARENARGVREDISSEMWEALNMLYWFVRAEDAPTKLEESPDDFFRSIMTGSLLFQGLTDQTLNHDQRWLFAQVAKYLERADVTCRIIETKFEILGRSATEEAMEMPLRNIHWMAVLRSCCSLEAFRRQHVGDMDPMRVAAFLVLERDLPRSVRYCVRHAHETAAAIRALLRPTAVDPAERVLGRLRAQLDYAQVSEMLSDGLPRYLQGVQNMLADAAVALQKTYFLY